MSDPAKPWPLWQKIVVPLVALVLAGELLPAIDLMTSGWAWRGDGSGFWLRDTAVAQAVYHGTRYLSAAVIIGLFGVLVYSLAAGSGDGGTDRRILARRAAAVLLALALGPGLLVHTVLKDHWGRPRPSQITAFGGSGHYVPPGIRSTQCDRNCSFPSGHAVAGFALILLGSVWPAQRRRWLWIGLAAGGFIGAVRIVQGGHFFSDVLASFAVVWLCDALLWRFMPRPVARTAPR